MIVAGQTQEITNTLPFESKNFSIAANAKAFDLLMGQLYSDPAAAMIREIVANANDSHKAAGVDKPVFIHVPNLLEPWFVVQDFGLGLSAEQIDNIYTTVFESTKDQDNEATGGFGLGSKTPYAVSDSFTVSAIKDGIKNEYLMFRDGNRNPSYMLTSTTKTDEGNGVKVTVPFNGSFCTYQEFEDKAKRVLSMFDTKFDCNLKIKHFKEGLVSLTDNIHLSKETRADYIVMAGIAYPLNDKHFYTRFHRGMYIEVPNGAVELTPSREQLFYSKETIAYVQSLDKQCEALYENIRKGMEELKTIKEKCLYREKWSPFLSLSGCGSFYNTVGEFCFVNPYGINVVKQGKPFYGEELYQRFSAPDLTVVLLGDEPAPNSRTIDRYKTTGVLPQYALMMKDKESYDAIKKEWFIDVPDMPHKFVSIEDVEAAHKAKLKEIRQANSLKINRKTEGHFWILVKDKAEFIQVEDFKEDDIVIIPSNTIESRQVTKTLKYNSEVIRLAAYLGKRVVYCRTVVARTLADDNKQLNEFLKEVKETLSERFGIVRLLDVWNGSDCSYSYSMSREKWILTKHTDEQIIRDFNTALLHKFEYDRLVSWIPEIRKAYAEMEKNDIGTVGIGIPEKAKTIYKLLKRKPDASKIDDFVLDGDY
jgi:hypothetical protein